MQRKTKEELNEEKFYLVAKIIAVICLGIAVATSYHCLKVNQDKTGVGIDHAKVNSK